MGRTNLKLGFVRFKCCPLGFGFAMMSGLGASYPQKHILRDMCSKNAHSIRKYEPHSNARVILDIIFIAKTIIKYCVLDFDWFRNSYRLQFLPCIDTQSLSMMSLYCSVFIGIFAFGTFVSLDKIKRLHNNKKAFNVCHVFSIPRNFHYLLEIFLQNMKFNILKSD